MFVSYRILVFVCLIIWLSYVTYRILGMLNKNVDKQDFKKQIWGINFIMITFLTIYFCWLVKYILEIVYLEVYEQDFFFRQLFDLAVVCLLFI